MAKEILVTHNVDALITRIQARTRAAAPSSPQLHEALTRIGVYVTSVAKVNVRQQRLIDTGRLWNSIRYEFFREGKTEGIQVGSFNVPYAAVHEFGFNGRVNVRAHNRRGSQVKAHTRLMRVRARPYLRPAIKTTQTFVIDTLRAALQLARSGG